MMETIAKWLCQSHAWLAELHAKLASWHARRSDYAWFRVRAAMLDQARKRRKAWPL